MARRRYVSTTISTDAAVNRLAQESEFAITLYTWMIPHAEDDALIHSGDPDEILAMVVPMRRDKTADDVEEALEAIERAGLIVWHDDMIEFDPESFYEYQTYVKSDRRRDSTLVCDCSRHSRKNVEPPGSAGNDGENAASLSHSHSPSHSINNPPTPLRPATKDSTMMRDPIWRTLVELHGPPAGRRKEFEDVWKFLSEEGATPELLRERAGVLVKKWSEGKDEPVVFRPKAWFNHWHSFDGQIAQVQPGDVKAHQARQKSEQRLKALEAGGDP